MADSPAHKLTVLYQILTTALSGVTPLLGDQHATVITARQHTGPLANNTKLRNDQTLITHLHACVLACAAHFGNLTAPIITSISQSDQQYKITCEPDNRSFHLTLGIYDDDFDKWVQFITGVAFLLPQVNSSEFYEKMATAFSNQQNAMAHHLSNLSLIPDLFTAPTLTSSDMSVLMSLIFLLSQPLQDAFIEKMIPLLPHDLVPDAYASFEQDPTPESCSRCLTQFFDSFSEHPSGVQLSLFKTMHHFIDTHHDEAIVNIEKTNAHLEIQHTVFKVLGRSLGVTQREIA